MSKLSGCARCTILKGTSAGSSGMPLMGQNPLEKVKKVETKSFQQQQAEIKEVKLNRLKKYQDETKLSNLLKNLF
jgi:hypothetical protein